MFAKLLKHEWKSTAGLLGILSLGALGFGVMGAVILRILVTNVETWLNSDSPLVLLISMLAMMLFFLAMALVVYTAGTHIFLLIRFFKNKFTDEGYLTFTLPVTSRQIFLSSGANILIWQMISGLVVTLAVGIALLFGTVENGAINQEIFEFFEMDFEDMFWLYEPENVHGYLALNVVNAVLTWLAGTVVTMTCVTVGAVVAKRHKLLAAIGIYYGATVVINILSGIGSFAVMIMTGISDTYYDTMLNVSVILEILLQAGLLLGGFFLSTYLMKHKLNLP